MQKTEIDKQPDSPPTDRKEIMKIQCGFPYCSSGTNHTLLKISVNYRNIEKIHIFFCTFFSQCFIIFLSCAHTEFISILNNEHTFFCKVRLALYYIIHKGNVFVICNFTSAGCAIPRFYCFLSFSPSNTVALSWFCLGFVWFVCLSISFVINY